MRLLDLVLLARGASLGWPDADQLDQARVWAGAEHADEGERFYRTKNVSADLRTCSPPLRVTRRVGDQPAGVAGLFIDLVRLFQARDPSVTALVALADSQNDAQALDGARRAAAYLREVLTPTMTFAFGVPHGDAECWFVAALTEADAPRHRDSLAALNFDPLREPERLTAQPNDAERDAKRVLRFLLGRGGATLAATQTGALAEDEYEALASWSPQDLDRLSAFVACGLSAFLAELRVHVAPRIIPGPPP